MNDSSEILGRTMAQTRDGYRRTLDLAQTGVYLYGAGFVGRWSVAYLSGLGVLVKGGLPADGYRHLLQRPS